MPGMVLQVRSNGQITLPFAVRRKANLEEGDLLGQESTRLLGRMGSAGGYNISPDRSIRTERG